MPSLDNCCKQAISLTMMLQVSEVSQRFSTCRYSCSTQMVCLQGSSPRTWPTSSFARRNGTSSKDSIATTTKDCPRHFSNSVRVCMRPSSRRFGGIPISFTVSPGFMCVFYGELRITIANRRFHSEPNGKCQTSENEDSCDKRAEDSPTHCSPWHFAKFIHR